MRRERASLSLVGLLQPLTLTKPVLLADEARFSWFTQTFTDARLTRRMLGPGDISKNGLRPGHRSVDRQIGLYHLKVVV